MNTDSIVTSTITIHNANQIRESLDTIIPFKDVSRCFVCRLDLGLDYIAHGMKAGPLYLSSGLADPLPTGFHSSKKSFIKQKYRHVARGFKAILEHLDRHSTQIGNMTSTIIITDIRPDKTMMMISSGVLQEELHQVIG